MLLTAGERISMAVLAMAISDLGRRGALVHRQPGRASSPTPTHGKARIIDVTPGRIRSALDKGAVAIVAGFQGVSQDTKDITTLGPRRLGHHRGRAGRRARRRGLRDLHRRRRRLHAPTRASCPTARRLDRHHLRGDARDGGERRQGAAPALRGVRPPVRPARSTSGRRSATAPAPGSSPRIDRSAATRQPSDEGDDDVEQPIISGVAHDRSEAKVTVVGVPDRPGEAAAIFETVAGAERQHRHDRAERVGGVHRAHRHHVHAAQGRGRPGHGGAGRSAGRRSGSSRCAYDAEIGKVSLVGAGMRSHPGVSATFFRALADAGVNVELISTSEIRISVVVPRGRRRHCGDARCTPRSASTPRRGEAVVYGGTGR